MVNRTEVIPVLMALSLLEEKDSKHTNMQLDFVISDMKEKFWIAES